VTVFVDGRRYWYDNGVWYLDKESGWS